MTATRTIQARGTAAQRSTHRGRPELTLVGGPAADKTVSTATPTMQSGVGIVALGGPLTADTLPECRLAVDTVLRHRPRFLVLELSRVDCDAKDAVLPVIAQLRWYAGRWGVTVLLAAAPNSLVTLLREARVVPAESIYPAFDLALDAAVTASHRTPAK